MVFRPGAGGPVLESAGSDRGATGGRGDRTPGQAWVATSEDGERHTLDEVREDGVASGEVRALARRIAARLATPSRARDRADAVTGGTGQLTTVPYRYNSDDIDLDRTLEMLTERPIPEDTDILVRERVRQPRAVLLMIDVSGSMRGEKTRIAAATVGALAGALATSSGQDELAVVAFWKNAAVVRAMGPAAGGARLLDDLLSIPAKGLTNVEFALRTGLVQLSQARARRRHAVLLSDAVHNAGPDPRDAAVRFPDLGPLHVLLETDGEHDADLGAALARLGGGRLTRIRTHRDVPPALNRALNG